MIAVQQNWQVLIVGGFALLTLIYQGWSARRDKREDWKREDAVAARAVIVARKADGVAADLKDSNVQTDQKLDVIHGLVNSNVTALIETAKDRELVILHLLQAVDPVDEAEVRSTRDKIGELETQLAERRKKAPPFEGGG
jgi:hypothetical protein